MSEGPVRPFLPQAGDDFRWDRVDLTALQGGGSAPFRDVTRQTLFRARDMRGELRYFEVAPAAIRRSSATSTCMR